MAILNAEQERLQETFPQEEGWHKWGPYLSERQWGTVREDYSSDGDAWQYFPHEQARSRAYRWGEDGIAGLSDSAQRLCLALALWNGRDPILKERLFGLTNVEGNHGEDVKELYYYLDATPSHSYLRMLYKYPQAEYPYDHLVCMNEDRDRDQPEYELLDTGLFDGGRYFDVSVEYAKASPEDILMRITAVNRGPEPATLHLLPQLWFRNTWSWNSGGARPLIQQDAGGLKAQHATLGAYCLQVEGTPCDFLFCDNDSNATRLWDAPPRPGFWKDAFHDRVVHGRTEAVNPQRQGTKAAAWFRQQVPAGESWQLRLRLTRGSAAAFDDFEQVFTARMREADEFHAQLQTGMDSADARAVQRQAFAGLIWSKQFFHLRVPRWLEGDPAQPAPPAQRQHGRNRDWRHLDSADILSVPDKWEYPWFAAWDLAFHCIAFAYLDPAFAKQQLVLLTREWYLHPNGQIPAYEWSFDDANPPVHAWAAWRVFTIERSRNGGHGDLAFLERILHKLMLNFTWWVNRKDAGGHNLFQGGFLGLDNIGVFNRSQQLPTGGFLDQADGTSWMAMYALNLMRISLELAQHNPVYEDIASKFFEHFLHIAEAMDRVGHGVGLWDPQDAFFYDVINHPGGVAQPLKLRSMVGLIPLFAVEPLDPELVDRLPQFKARLEWFLEHHPHLAALVSHWHTKGHGERRLLSLLHGRRLRQVLQRLFDEGEFLSPYGVRGLSKAHEREPFEYQFGTTQLSVTYEPAESRSGLFGGNSNWRGPVWFPVNLLIIESLQKFDYYYGGSFKIECPTGSGHWLTLEQAAGELSARLTRIFLRDGSGRRPVYGSQAMLQDDPAFRDHILFYEYFHGEDGHGLGASHQTGWTGLVAKLLMPRRTEPGVSG